MIICGATRCEQSKGEFTSPRYPCIQAARMLRGVEHAFARSLALAWRGLALAVGSCARAVRGERCTKVQCRLCVAPSKGDKGKQRPAQCCVRALARALAASAHAGRGARPRSSVGARAGGGEPPLVTHLVTSRPRGGRARALSVCALRAYQRTRVTRPFDTNARARVAWRGVAQMCIHAGVPDRQTALPLTGSSNLFRTDRRRFSPSQSLGSRSLDPQDT